jgi:putative mRNA 3-end processing factor
MIYLDGYAISLDRREHSSNVDFVSHAHSDHISAAKSSKSVIASSETARLLEVAKGIKIKECREQIAGVKLLDSGHMLGAKQIRIESNNKGIITYTGDFMLQHAVTCKPIEMLETDTLIIDSTYCTPEIKFDPREEVESAIELWVRRKQSQGIILFGAHRMGKAQELTRLLNMQGIMPFTTEAIGKINSVYRESGIKLEYSCIEAEAGGAGFGLESAVGIIETHRLDEIASQISKNTGRRVFRASATGFAKFFRFNTDVQFPLSDHADFRQSLNYIETANPKKILTYGSNSEVFAQNLSKAGYNAEPFRNEVMENYRIVGIEADI